MSAYIIAREGDAYRFNVSRIRHAGSNVWLLPLIMLLMIPGIIYGMILDLPPALFFVGWGALLAWGIWHTVRVARRGPTYGAPNRKLLVGPAGVTLPNGKTIPAGRINNVEVRNEYGGAFPMRSYGLQTVAVGGVAGAAAVTANLASAIGAGIAESRALSRFYVSVQHSGTQERVAERMDELGASGLAADIFRALQGQSLD